MYLREYINDARLHERQMYLLLEFEWFNKYELCTRNR
jgi:hypothetical protein